MHTTPYWYYDILFYHKVDPRTPGQARSSGSPKMVNKLNAFLNMLVRVKTPQRKVHRNGSNRYATFRSWPRKSYCRCFILLTDSNNFASLSNSSPFSKGEQKKTTLGRACLENNTKKNPNERQVNTAFSRCEVKTLECISEPLIGRDSAVLDWTWSGIPGYLLRPTGLLAPCPVKLMLAKMLLGVLKISTPFVRVSRAEFRMPILRVEVVLEAF